MYEISWNILPCQANSIECNSQRCLATRSDISTNTLNETLNATKLMFKLYSGTLVKVGPSSTGTFISFWLNHLWLQDPNIQPIKRVFTFVTFSSQIEPPEKHCRITTLTRDNQSYMIHVKIYHREFFQRLYYIIKLKLTKNGVTMQSLFEKHKNVKLRN